MNLKGSGIKKNKQKFIKFSGSEWTYEVNYKEIINDLLEMVENYGNREVNRNMIINYIRDRIRYAEYNCDEMNKNDTNLC